MPWPSVDSKKQLRLNILRHRQKLLKLLENTDDTTLKPRIKFDPTDFDKLLGKSIKKEPITNDVKTKKKSLTNEIKTKKESLTNDIITIKDPITNGVKTKKELISNAVKIKKELILNDLKIKKEPISINVKIKKEPISNDVKTIKEPTSNGVEIKKEPISNDVKIKEPILIGVKIKKEPISNVVKTIKEPILIGVKIKKEPISNVVKTIKETISNSVDIKKEPISNDVITINESISNGVTITKEPISSSIKISKEPISNDVKSIKKPISNNLKTIKDLILDDSFKDELIDELCDSSVSSDDLISVGSDEGWNNTPPVESEIDDRRESRHFISMPYSYEYPSNTLTEDHMYASDPMDETCNKYKKNSIIPTKKRQRLSVGQQTRSRPRETFDRIKHNAKERACREEIGKMFIVLREVCGNLDTNRRVPSKQCILSSAKNECNTLMCTEINLIAEKRKLRARNEALMKKLTKMKC